MTADGPFRNLCAVYADKSDEELLELHEDRDDLTDVAQQALAQVMQERRLSPQTAVARPEPEPERGGETGDLSGNEAALWTFSDAFQTSEAIRLLGEAGIWHRVVDRTTTTDGGVRSQVLLGLMLIVSRNDLDAAVDLLRQRMGLFPGPEGGDTEVSPLHAMEGTVLLSMFDRGEGLLAAAALGRAGISYVWRDGSDETGELPDDRTVAIEVRGPRLEKATRVVEEMLGSLPDAG